MKLPFPARVYSQHSATLGKTGSGKSSGLRVGVEYLLDAGKRVVIIDPKGDWWGLKVAADGKAPGYPVICFGDFKEARATDVPINPHSGKEIAELIATGNRPAIIGFRGWMPAQLTRFWLDFAPALFNSNAGELYVVIDEIQNFAPKGRILDPDSGKCLHWTNRMMSEGRGLGMIFLIASQRPQKVHNDTLDNCETLIAMRVNHPRSREAIKEWMDGNGDPAKGKEILATLAQLKRGEAYVWSPENEFGPERVQFPMFSTFDSFAAPQAQKRVLTAGWSTVDLDAVKQKLAAVIAEHKANDPKELKQEIERLKAEKRKLEAANHVVATRTASKEEIERASAAAARTAADPLRRQLQKVRDLAKQAIENFARAGAPLNAIANLDVVQPPSTTPNPPAARPQTPPRPAPAESIRSIRTDITPDPNAGELSIGMRKILAAAAQFQGIELEELTTLTGYKKTSRNEYIGRLIRAGLAERKSDGRIYPTDAGMNTLGKDYEALPTGAALYEWHKQRLPEGELKILRHLVEEAAGADVDKEQLSERVGFKKTSLNEYLGRLSRRRLIVKGSGTVKASESLFG